MNVCVAFLLLIVPVALAESPFALDCPHVVRDPSKAKTDCVECQSCGFSPGYKCCLNECGGHSCARVRWSCKVGDMIYLHGDSLGYYEDKDKKNCNYCYCKDGNSVCYKRPC